MWFERIVAEGLSHNSYMIGSGGKAAVIDPRRDCGVYLILADRHDTVITHIFETHRNEDYVSGARSLRTGATHRSTTAHGWTLRTGTVSAKATGSRLGRWNSLSSRPRDTLRRASRLSWWTPKSRASRTWSFPATPSFPAILRGRIFSGRKKSGDGRKNV